MPTHPGGANLDPGAAATTTSGLNPERTPLRPSDTSVPYPHIGYVSD